MATTFVVSERFRDMAKALESEIEKKFARREENTPKRQRQAASCRIDGHHLMRLRQALLVLADAHDENRCPEILRSVRTKAELYDMLRTRTGSNGYYDIHDTGEYQDNSEKAIALRNLMESTVSDEEQKAAHEASKLAKIKDAEAKVRFADIAGFWPTPTAVVESMLERVDLPHCGSVLDPSAGIGSILEVVRDKWPTANMVYCEQHHVLCDILKMKGFNGLCADFLEQEPSSVIDLVVMNPPFENGQDAQHIRRAYEWLRPGGSLVAIASASVLHNSRRNYAEFREWLASVDATIEEMDDCCFNGNDAFRQTSVRTVMISIVDADVK